MKSNPNLIMTYKEWTSFDFPLNEYFFNCSGSGQVDMDIYTWPKWGDPLINEPIGVSIAIDLNMLQNCNDLIKSGQFNSKMVHCCFKVENDKSRRGKNEINRNIIANNLKNNNIKNTKLPPDVFLKEMVNTKFTVSPEGNGVDTHRTWEGIYLKSIPIVEEHEGIMKKYEGLPILYTKDYSEITEDYLAKKYNEMMDKTYDFNKLFVSNYYDDKEVFEHIQRRSNHYCNKYKKYSWYPIDLSRVKKFNQIYNDVSLITLTTDGYKHLTLNALESMHRLNTELKTHIYSLDNVCKDSFSKYTDNFTSMDVNFSKMASYKDENWSLVTLHKLKAIHTELQTKKYVLFFDGDIVFENIKFLTDTYERMIAKPELDLVCQVEYYIDKKSLCSGFLMIKSSDKTKDFFNPESYLTNGKYNNDQDYLNDNKEKLNYERLPCEYYPNGKWHREKNPKHPYMIHFNFAKGNDKMVRMKKNGKWYV
jgi:hypothetical protein